MTRNEQSSGSASDEMNAVLEEHRVSHGPACEGRDMCLVLAPDMIGALKALADERNLRRISVRTAAEDNLLEVPLKLGLAPRPAVWAALSALADADDEFIVSIERVTAWPKQGHEATDRDAG